MEIGHIYVLELVSIVIVKEVLKPSYKLLILHKSLRMNSPAKTLTNLTLDWSCRVIKLKAKRQNLFLTFFVRKLNTKT